MGAKIVVVEDSSIVALDIKRCLTNLGYEVAAVVPSGEEAIIKVEEHKPDMVIMDIMLKGEMDGIEAAGQIRSRFNMPVIYLTAYSDKETLERAKITEPFGYVIKPFEERELHTTIEMGLYRNKMDKKLRESEDWFFTTLRSIGDAVIATDTKGAVKFMNPVAENLTGWKQEEAAGKYLEEVFCIISEETNDKVENPVWKVLQKGTVVGLANHTLLISSDGSKIPIDDSAAPIMDAKGRIAGVVLVFHDISERRKAEEALRENEERYRSLVELSPDAIALHSQGKIIFANTSAAKLYRASSPEELIGKPVLDFVHPEYHETVKQRIQDIINKIEEVPSIEEKFIMLDGTVLDVEVVAAGLIYNGKPAVQVIVRDITARKLAEEALRKNEENMRLITDNMMDIISQTDAEGIIQYQSPSVKTILGYDPGDFLGKSAFGFVHPQDMDVVLAAFQRGISTASPGKTEFRNRHADGRYVWLETIGNPLLDKDGQVTGAIFNTRDITERKQMEEQLKFLSLQDPLTGLYNRAYFEQEMHRLEGGRCTPLGVIVCDIDGLKFVNDTLGHETGDALLVAAADAFRKSFRSGDMIARIGGDEFAILLPNSDRKDLEGATRRIKSAVDRHNAANPELPLSISVGFALRSDRTKMMGDLFKVADNNMYREKLHRSRSTRSAIVNILLKALEARDFLTEGHAERLQSLVAYVAVAIGLPEHGINDLRLLARFHDIGKVGIPDHILLKPGPLTSEEYKEMQRHCEIGNRIAQSAPELALIADWILKHHEWWNGEGYPIELKGVEIPLECRILSIADAYDAMTRDRPYRRAISHEEAIAEIRRCSGTQFDPQLASLFIRILGKQNPCMQDL